MDNYQLYKLLMEIEKIDVITEEVFTDILKQYNLSKDEYLEKKSLIESDEVIEIEDDWIKNRRDIFHKEKHNYFTICSKTDFNDLTSPNDHDEWESTLIYHPLNDHSRNKLHRGDVLFCYRQGQFGSLGMALNNRGIYGVGIAATDPMILYPNEQGHNKWGIVVVFPILLQQHLQLRNIQMHPQTIDLTPYNGNRNDALQYIEEERHSQTLINLIMQTNKQLKDKFSEILSINSKEDILPDEKWKEDSNKIINIINKQFDIDLFLEHLNNAGLIYNKEIVTRFIAALCSKRFVILTGLSGSGKTQLALNFVRWICRHNVTYFELLKKALNSEAFKSNYEINYISEKTIEVSNLKGSAGKIIPIPVKVIYEWYDALINGDVSAEDDPKEARHVIGEKSIYQKYIYGFYNEISKLAKLMIDFSCDNDNCSRIKQYEIVAVGADWTNREPLLGYPNALQNDEYVKPDNNVVDLLVNAVENPQLPFFLILDEMNLSHVERYFADFLSTMETGEAVKLYNSSENRNNAPAEIKLPNNLYIIGTVNIDETTYMFSPKVLDRANTIEFRIEREDMKKFLNNRKEYNIEEIQGKGSDMAEDFLGISLNNKIVNTDQESLNDEILNFFDILGSLGAEFGYRSANEINVFISKLAVVDSNLSENQKIDFAVMQKMLPKVHGSRRKICPILIKLAQLCVTDKIKDIETEIINNEKINYGDTDVVKYPLSLFKILRMYRNAVDNGYASYAEA